MGIVQGRQIHFTPSQRRLRPVILSLSPLRASMAIGILVQTLASALVTLVLFFLSAAAISARRRRRSAAAAGFFHPYTNDGGGGERVLWCAVRAVQDERPDLECAVFTGDDASPESLAARAVDRFGVKLLRPPKVSPPISS